jgi:extradiol dioxygenase family protein
MSERPRFHLAFPVVDLPATERFFVELFGCRLGRTDARWIDLDFYGHQITAHLVAASSHPASTNPVDGDLIPASHFGLILPWAEWHALRDRLLEKGVEFLLAPKIRFAGEVGEQATMFLRDPSGNALELKSFRDDASVFAR